MRTSESVIVPAEPVTVFPFVVDLDVYPQWLPLVHASTRDGDTDAPQHIREGNRADAKLMSRQ